MRRNNIFIIQWIVWLCITLTACSGIEDELSFATQANDSGSDTRASLVEYTINVETAGTLGSLVESRGYSDAQKLIATGKIGYKDVNYVDVNMPTVEVLDLAGATYNNTSLSVRFLSSSTSIKEISLPGNITSITGSAEGDGYSSGYGPFNGCSSLTRITLPDGLTNIESGAFYGCSSLTNINIPEGVTSIGNYAFSGCSSLTSITIPEGVTSIGDDAFECCSSLTSINIPESVTSIGRYAFYGCSSLTSINIPESVTSIGYCAFADCSSLTSIHIPESVTEIGSAAFFGCSSLTSIHIPKGVTSIGWNAFYRCSSLTSINIPESVTSIGDGAFEDCSSLTSITIPEGVTSIGSDAFHGCSSLTSIHIPEGVTSIGDDAFYGCSSLTSITIPESVTSIGRWAFYNCSSLTSITIPESVTSIGRWAFYNCSSSMKVYWNCDLSISGLFNSNPLLIYTQDGSIPVDADKYEYVIVNDVTEKFDLNDWKNNFDFSVDSIFAKKVIYKKCFFSTWSSSYSYNRWYTISLPFKPTQITHEEKETIAPFDSNIEGAKNFWLRELTPDGYQDVTEMEAGHAYIIAMPTKSSYSSDFRLDGTVTFSAENVTLTWEPVVAVGPTYSMYPTYNTVKKSMDIYAMNSEYSVDGYSYGHVWVRGAMDVAPFEAYVKLNDGATMRSVLPMADGKRTAVRGASSSSDASTRGVYGQRKPRKEDM
jgi:hypothetical protein